MSSPYFFVDSLQDQKIMLGEDSSKHIISVLRMTEGEEILLTDGQGNKAKATIIDDNRKRTMVQVASLDYDAPASTAITIAISLIKNTSRFEWFLEKATEIGVQQIIPLICDRTEKEKFRQDRMQQIMISAMLQSQQSWMPELTEPLVFKKAVELEFEKKFIAHCAEGSKIYLPKTMDKDLSSCIMLIGPEGDFTEQEIELAIHQNFTPVSLGKTRLRTETAGIVAATLLTSARE